MSVPELVTPGELTRLWDHLKKGQKQRLYGWFHEWADIEVQATVLRWDEPLVVPGLLQTEDYPRGASAVSAAVGYEFSLIPRVYFWKVRRVYSERSALEEEDERDY